MAVDPAKFVVIDDLYAQHADYPGFCARTVELLLGLKDLKTIDQLTDVVAAEIKVKNSRQEHRLQIGTHFHDEQKQYGVSRRKENGLFSGLYTPLGDKDGIRYRAAYKRFLKREFGNEQYCTPFIKTFSHITKVKDEATGKTRRYEVPLSTISNCYVRKGGRLTNQMLGKEALYHTNIRDLDVADAVWRDINTLFQTALDSTESRDKRIEKSYECYWLISHYCPLVRRSATLARIMLAYLEEKVGFDLPPTLPGIDLNMEALTRTMPDFLHQVDIGAFFDPSLSSADVLDWHKRAAALQPPIAGFEEAGYPKQFAMNLLEQTPLVRTHAAQERRPHDYTLRLAEESPQPLGHGV